MVEPPPFVSAVPADPAAAAPGLGPSRPAQLERDLSLTPEERVRAAEETLRLTDAQEGTRASRTVAFDSYEAFLDWKRDRDARR